MLVAWYLLYGPKYIYHVHVVDPSVIMKQRQKDLTFLDLPPDALKQVKPKPTPAISDKDRVAQTPHPTLDKKTLEELEAMRRAAPPAPAPQPSQQPAAPAPSAPQPQGQVAEQHPPTPPAQPLPQNNQAKLEAPPQAPQPSFRSGSSTNPNEQLQQAMRQAMQGKGQYGGDNGANLPSQHPGMNGAVDILSDTMGVDFGPYIQRVVWDTERAWWPIIPESARPPLDKQGKVMIRFKINPDGSVRDMILEGPSGDVALDRAAWARHYRGRSISADSRRPSKARFWSCVSTSSTTFVPERNSVARDAGAGSTASPEAHGHSARGRSHSVVQPGPRRLARDFSAGLVALVALDHRYTKNYDLYTSGFNMRTNIDIDDKLMEQAMRSSGAPTKKAVVEEALRMLVRTQSQASIRASSEQ